MGWREEGRRRRRIIESQLNKNENQNSNVINYGLPERPWVYLN